jgi:hypothetical protein
MGTNDLAPGAIVPALIVLLALALGPGIAVPARRARTAPGPGLLFGEDPSAPPLPAPVRTLDR